MSLPSDVWIGEDRTREAGIGTQTGVIHFCNVIRTSIHLCMLRHSPLFYGSARKRVDSRFRTPIPVGTPEASAFRLQFEPGDIPQKERMWNRAALELAGRPQILHPCMFSAFLPHYCTNPFPARPGRLYGVHQRNILYLWALSRGRGSEHRPNLHSGTRRARTSQTKGEGKQ